jgi:DNA-binding transcriptional MerR regulator
MKTLSQTKTRYQPHEFAERAGVTVRALHYYDRLGLLKPSDRTASGYRLYSPPDFARLQQIVTLKFIGFPLRKIKTLLSGANLPVALDLQRRTLEQKRRQLDQAVAAIAQAERVLASRREPDWKAFAKIIEVIQMQTNNDWSQNYYSEEAKKQLAERKHLWSPELQKKTEDEWAALFKDLESAASENLAPTSERALALADRHARLIEGFTGGNAGIEAGLGKLWSDRTNWPDEARKQVFEPFAQRGIAAAQGAAPRFLSDPARDLLQQACQARKAKKP